MEEFQQQVPAYFVEVRSVTCPRWSCLCFVDPCLPTRVEDAAVEESAPLRRFDRRSILDDTIVTIGKIGKVAESTQNQLANTNSQLGVLSSTVQTIGQRLIDHQIETEKCVRKVDEKVDLVDDKVDNVAESLKQIRSQLAKRDETSALFMPFIHTLFNGQTGVVGMCPVGYEDSGGTMHKVVVASLPLLIWYFARAKEGVRVPELSIRSFFSSGYDFMLYPKLAYSDFVDVTLRTPFKIRAIGSRGDRNEAYNRQNFLIFEGESVQKALAQAKVDYPLKTKNLELLLSDTRRTHTHGNDGNKIAYTQKSLRSMESGPILIYGNKSFSMSEKARIPAMGYPWTVENYDLPYVREFFKTSKDLMRGRHIVGGEVLASSSVVLTHAQEYEKRKREIEAGIAKTAKKRKV